MTEAIRFKGWLVVYGGGKDNLTIQLSNTINLCLDKFTKGSKEWYVVNNMLEGISIITYKGTGMNKAYTPLDFYINSKYIGVMEATLNILLENVTHVTGRVDYGPYNFERTIKGYKKTKVKEDSTGIKSIVIKDNRVENKRGLSFNSLGLKIKH